jgi:hypothetical protein
LWAWWYEQVVDMLQKRRTSASVAMVHQRVEQIRDDYTVGRLPTSVDRASWVDNDLIAIDELGRYQEELVDEWGRHFARRVRRLPADATEEDRQQAGEELLWQVVENVTVRVRDQYDQIFFHRVQHHYLADEARVGWHPGVLRIGQERRSSGAERVEAREGEALG